MTTSVNLMLLEEYPGFSQSLVPQSQYRTSNTLLRDYGFPCMMDPIQLHVWCANSRNIAYLRSVACRIDVGCVSLSFPQFCRRFLVVVLMPSAADSDGCHAVGLLLRGEASLPPVIWFVDRSHFPVVTSMQDSLIVPSGAQRYVC